MYWIALLVLGLIGFNRLRRVLAKGMQSVPEEGLKLLTFVGVILLFVFGFLGVGLSMDFFVALLVAAATWLGILAALEQMRRSREVQEQGATAAIQVDPVWRKRHEQRQAEERGALFTDDPWGVLAAQRKAGEHHPRSSAEYFNRAETEPEPLVEPHVGIGRDDGGLVIFSAAEPQEDVIAEKNPQAETVSGTGPGPPEPAVPPVVEEARTDIVSVLKQHADQFRGKARLDMPSEADAVEQESPDDEPDAAAPAQAADASTDAGEPAPEAAAEPEPEAAPGEPDPEGDSWLKENEPARELDPKITRHKDELEARPLDAQGGRYKYKPKLVKSLFSTDDD